MKQLNPELNEYGTCTVLKAFCDWSQNSAGCTCVVAMGKDCASNEHCIMYM